MVTNKAQIFLFTLLVVSNHKVIAQAPTVPNPVPPAAPTGDPAAAPVKAPAPSLSLSTTGTPLGKDDSQQIVQKIHQLAEECGNLQINCTEVYDPGNTLTILEKMFLQTVQSVCASIKQNVVSINAMQCNQDSLSAVPSGSPSVKTPSTASPPSSTGTTSPPPSSTGTTSPPPSSTGTTSPPASSTGTTSPPPTKTGTPSTPAT